MNKSLNSIFSEADARILELTFDDSGTSFDRFLRQCEASFLYDLSEPERQKQREYTELRAITGWSQEKIEETCKRLNLSFRGLANHILECGTLDV